MEVGGVLHAPAVLPAGKEHTIHIEEEAGWTWEPVWTFLEKRWVSSPCHEPNHDPWIFQPLACTMEKNT